MSCILKPAWFFHRFGWWLSNNILGHEWKILRWCFGPAPQEAGCVKPNSNPHPNISKWLSFMLGYALASVSRTHRLWSRLLQLVQSPSSRGDLAESSVAKQPHIITVLAASARLKHWWGCYPFKYWSRLYAGGWFNIKMASYQYRKSHCGDKTILRPSYLHNGISYTGKTTSLYWIGQQFTSAATVLAPQGAMASVIVLYVPPVWLASDDFR